MSAHAEDATDVAKKLITELETARMDSDARQVGEVQQHLLEWCGVFRLQRNLLLDVSVGSLDQLENIPDLGHLLGDCRSVQGL